MITSPPLGSHFAPNPLSERDRLSSGILHKEGHRQQEAVCAIGVTWLETLGRSVGPDASTKRL